MAMAAENETAATTMKTAENETTAAANEASRLTPTSREERWRRFVLDYNVEVPEEAIENELAYIKLDMRHRMQYEQLTGGGMHLFPDQELEQQDDELRTLALFEAKMPRVVKIIVGEQGFAVTPEELEAEARVVAERQGATMDMMRMFFGENLAGLERDILERKAIDWACEQVT